MRHFYFDLSILHNFPVFIFHHNLEIYLRYNFRHVVKVMPYFSGADWGKMPLQPSFFFIGEGDLHFDIKTKYADYSFK